MSYNALYEIFYINIFTTKYNWLRNILLENCRQMHTARPELNTARDNDGGHLVSICPNRWSPQGTHSRHRHSRPTCWGSIDRCPRSKRRVRVLFAHQKWGEHSEKYENCLDRCELSTMLPSNAGFAISLRHSWADALFAVGSQPPNVRLQYWCAPCWVLVGRLIYTRQRSVALQYMKPRGHGTVSTLAILFSILKYKCFKTWIC